MHRWTPCWVALVVLALLAERGTAQDKDKKDDPKKPAPAVPDKKDADKKAPKTTVITGELVHFEPGKQNFRVKVTQYYREVNQGALNGLVQAQNSYQQAQGAYQQAMYRRPADARALSDAQNKMAQAQQQMLQHQAKLYDVKSKSQEFPIQATEDMKVRLPNPKSTFDDMGNIKIPTTKERAAMMGPDKLFDGEFSDLNTGSLVRVTLILPKVPQKPVKKDDIALEENKLEATKLEVLKEPVPEGAPGVGGVKPKR